MLHHQTLDAPLTTTHALTFGGHNKAFVVTIHKTQLLPIRYITNVKTIKRTNYLYVPIGLALNHILSTHSAQQKQKSAFKKEYKTRQVLLLFLLQQRLTIRQMIHALGKFCLQNQNLHLLDL